MPLSYVWIIVYDMHKDLPRVTLIRWSKINYFFLCQGYCLLRLLNKYIQNIFFEYHVDFSNGLGYIKGVLKYVTVRKDQNRRGQLKWFWTLKIFRPFLVLRYFKRHSMVSASCNINIIISLISYPLVLRANLSYFVFTYMIWCGDISTTSLNE